MARRRRRRRKGGSLLLGGSLAAGLATGGGCQGAASPERDVTPDSQPDAGGGSDSGIAGPVFPANPIGPSPFDFSVVDPGPVARPPARVLYSWTTDEQYAQLRANPVLLTRTERPGMGPGLIRTVLARLAAAGDPLSQALSAPEFQTARFAWPDPWATLRGWEGESYGQKLIRVELRQDAWVMTLFRDEWLVFDLDDQPVSRMDAIQNPGRIGAIYHVYEGERGAPACQGSFTAGGAGSFREYFLPNEAMVARWSLATMEIRDRLEQDIALITTYRGQAAGWSTNMSTFETNALCHWLGETYYGGGIDPEYLQRAALASPLYLPSVENLDALIIELEGALFEPDPLVHVP